MNQTAIIYARVSTVKQADDGLPVESQIERCHQKAESVGVDVLKVFTDAGLSGRTDDRPAFRDAIAYCKVYQVNLFICWSTSRFARNKLDAAFYKRELEKHGTRVIYVSVDLDNRTDSGWMMESILEIFDEHYSRQIAADTLRSMQKNAEDGFFNGGREPFGYQAIPEGKRKRLAIKEEEAPVVRSIFYMCIDGAGAKTIAMTLNEQNISHRGRRWSKNSVAHVLKNMAYAGYTVFNRKDKANGRIRPMEEWSMKKSHQPIIPETDFRQVQDIISGRAPGDGCGSPHSTFAFTGLLKCERCGQNLQIESATGRSSTYHYYNCRAAARGIGCENRRLPARELDEFLTSVILEKILTRSRLEEIVREVQELAGHWIRDRAQRRKDIVADLQEVETRLRNLFELLELHGKEAPNLADLTVRLRELKARRQALEQSLVNLENEEDPALEIDDQDIADAASTIRDIVMSTTDNKKLRVFFSSFIKGIVVGESRIHFEYNQEALVNRAGIDTVHNKDVWLPELGLQRIGTLIIPIPAKFARKAA